MSAAAMLLQFIFAVLQFMASLQGIAAFGAGVVLFMGMAFVPALFGVGHSLANVHIGLAKWCVGRVAIVLSEHGELLWKRMSFDDLGVEEMTFGDTVKLFDDPATALHHWGNTPFALADEVRGVLFDPRHAALGMRKRSAEQGGRATRPATEAEWDADNIGQWVLGAFEMPRKNELVDLAAVRAIIDGGERAEYPERVKELYKLSREPFASKTPLLRLSMPIIAFLAVFGGIWVVLSQGGSGGGATDTVSFGTVLIAAGSGGLVKHAKRAVGSAWTLLKYAIIASILPLAFVVLALVTNPVFALVVFTVVGAGFWLLPFFAFIGKAVSPLGGALSRHLFLRLGFAGYRKPVLEWRPDGYKLREYSDLDTTEDVTWYGFCGGVLGFTYDPSPGSWGPDHIANDTLEEYGESAVTDGGSDDRIPAGHLRASGLTRADGYYAAFVPSNARSDKYYLHSGIALQRFQNSAIGEKSMKKLLESKEKFGSGAWGVSDKTLAMLTGGAMVLAVAFWGVLLFFL